MSENKNNEAPLPSHSSKPVANTSMDENQKKSPDSVDVVDKEVKLLKEMLDDIATIFNNLGKASDVYNKFLDNYSENMESEINNVLLQKLGEKEEREKLEEIRKYYRDVAEKLRDDAQENNATMTKMAGAALGISGLIAVTWIVVEVIKSCKGLKLMTMNDLVRKAPSTPKLEHHYIEVLRALGEVKQLKKEGSEAYDEELYKMLTQLKAVLEALIFKGSYGVKVEVGAKKLSKLITDIAKDENFASSWMANLDEEERRTLYRQACEIKKVLLLQKQRKTNINQ